MGVSTSRHPVLALAETDWDAATVSIDARRPVPVLTVTLNPAVDVSMTVDRLVSEQKMRAYDVRREPGGGGVNVANVLRRLAVPATSLVVVGGATGDELTSLMRSCGLAVVEVPIDGSTRESVAIGESDTGRQYRVSLPGPLIEDPDELRRLVIEEARDASVVVLSGGLAPGLPPDFYVQVISELAPDTTAIVDTHGPALAAVAASKADVVKPSQRELADLVGWEPATPDEIERAVTQVLDQGNVGAVLASRGPTGAVLGTRDREMCWFRAPPVHPVSTIGAGDSMVGAIAAGLANGDPLVDAVRFGVAAGTAAVLTPGTELCDVTEAKRLVDAVDISPGFTTRHS
jgi:6-phosphofructokinase 2